VTHGCSNALHLIRGDRGSDTRAIDDNTGVGFTTSDGFCDARGRVGVVNRFSAERSEIVHGDSLPAKRRDERRLQRQAGMIAANRHTPDIGHGRKAIIRSIHKIFGEDGDSTILQRIGGERRDSTTPCQRDGLAHLERSRVGLRDDVEAFHVIVRAIVKTLFTAEQIHTRIHEMAAQMNADYPDSEPLHFVAVLKGAFVFLSDLARAMTPRPVTLDFIAVSSYGAATKSSGEVRLLKDLDTPLQGRDVIIVEDIVDTGLTLHYLQDVLRARDPKSLKTACLLSKPSRRKVDVEVEYIGFEIEDKFVVGYGLDHAGQFRHLPFIGIQE
jgi:hypoxanthine phosphoribosyltransferase